MSNLRKRKFQQFYKYKNMVIKMIETSRVCDYNIRDPQDVVQDIYCKIWLYIDSYDLNKSSISTYLNYIVTNIIRNYYKADKCKKRNLYHTTSLDKKLFYCDELLSDNIIDETISDPHEDIDAKVIVNEMKNELSGIEREIFHKRFYENKKMRVIGDELNITKQWVSLVITKMCTRLQETKNELLSSEIEQGDDYANRRKKVYY